LLLDLRVTVVFADMWVLRVRSVLRVLRVLGVRQVP
jgi:hypothetical protein